MTPVNEATRTKGTGNRQVVRREGEYWTIEFDGEVVRLRDSRGLHYLVMLLRNPGRKLSATDMVAAAGARTLETPITNVPTDATAPTNQPRNAERARLTVTKGIKAALERIAAAHPALGEHLGATIRRGYSCVYTPDPRNAVTWRE